MVSARSSARVTAGILVGLIAAAACRSGDLAGTGSACDESRSCRLGYRCADGRCAPDPDPPAPLPDAGSPADAPSMGAAPEPDAGDRDVERPPDVKAPDGPPSPDRPAQCPAGRADCNDDPRDGCETDLGTTENCGQCRRRCSAPHGTTACQASNCALVACEPRFNQVGDACLPCTPGTTAYCGRGTVGVFCAIASSDGTLMPPLAFTQTDYADEFGWSTPEHRFGTFQFPDLNGDGRADVCGRGSQGFVCGLGQEAGVPFAAAENREVSVDDEWIAERSRWGSAQFADVNGDHRADLCIRTAQGTACALWSGTLFGEPRVWTTGTSDADGFSAAGNWATLRFPDLNGDGRADHCGRSASGLMCGLSDGSRFSWSSWDPAGYFGDANGWGQPARWATIRYPDVNGDGRADVCARGETGLVCALSKAAGTGFDAPRVWTPFFAGGGDTDWGSSRTYFSTLQFPDLDGDGRQDVCARGSGGLYCGLSTGESFGTVTRWTPSFADADGWNRPEYAETIRFFDRNGDRAADVCGRSANHILCALSDGKSRFTTATQTAGFTEALGWSAIDKWTTFAANVIEPGTCRTRPTGEVVPSSPGFRLSF
jgi:hypothetical protein